jgi:hypothetical protein
VTEKQSNVLRQSVNYAAIIFYTIGHSCDRFTFGGEKNFFDKFCQKLCLEDFKLFSSKPFIFWAS